VKLVVMKKDIQSRNLQHHEEYKIEVPPDEEKNITHLQKILKNYKILSGKIHTGFLKFESKS
jgi:hypothetical protein